MEQIECWKVIGRVPHPLTVFCNEPKRLGPVYRTDVILSPYVLFLNEDVTKV